MFNKNYLGHELINIADPLNSDYDFKCLKCGLDVFYSNSNNIYYSIRSNNLYFPSCDEWVIKQIIE